MMESEKNKELVPKHEDEVFPFFPLSPFSDFDNYISQIMHSHNRWYDREFGRMFNHFDSFFQDFLNEKRIDNFFINKNKAPMELIEFSTLRPKFFPSSFFTLPFSSFFSSPYSYYSSSFLRPFSSLLPRVHNGWSNVNIVDKDKKYEITIPAPGLSKDDLEIDVDNDRLNIKGMRMDEFQETGKNNSYHFKEKKMSCFQQSILLPECADPDNVKATLKDGILKINIDKLDHAEKKKVEIE